MPRYRVTLRRSSVEIIEAANPYQAAIVANERTGGDVEIESVTPAFGRPPTSNSQRKTASKSVASATKTVVKKRRPMSAENRAKLAQNLVKARAARAAKAKKSAVKRPAKKKATGATKKR